MSKMRDYFWPNPPRRISAESSAAMKADLNDKGLFSGSLEDKHRSAVDIWIRHSDNLSRTANQEWMSLHGNKFVKRWSVVAWIACAGAWFVSGNLWLEVPLVAIGIVAIAHAAFFQYLLRIDA